MYKTRDIRLQDYLAVNGCYAYKNKGRTAFYRKTPQLLCLLDKYYIEFFCIPNKAGL